MGQRYREYRDRDRDMENKWTETPPALLKAAQVPQVPRIEESIAGSNNLTVVIFESKYFLDR